MFVSSATTMMAMMAIMTMIATRRTRRKRRVKKNSEKEKVMVTSTLVPLELLWVPCGALLRLLSSY